MIGKTVIVTGAGAGIGLETADALAQKGAELILVELDRQRGEQAGARIARGASRPRLFVADLSLQADVRRVSAEILGATERIDVLINNAGAMFNTRQETVDGLERTFALNHMGYFLLTHLLLDRIMVSSPARIISVSSRAHQFETLDFDDLQSESNYSGPTVYYRSKLANVLFTRALARRLRGTGVTANSLEPGPGMIRTDFFKSAEYSGPFVDAISAPQGAKTSIYLASSPEVEGITGQYFANCHVAIAAKAAEDQAAAERLWGESCRLCGLSVDFASTV